MSFDKSLMADARLRVLQALDKQTDHRLSDIMVGHALDAWGHRRSRDYARTQMRALAELGAVLIVEDSDAVLIAELTPSGQDHVRRRGVVEGVKRPDPGE